MAATLLEFTVKSTDGVLGRQREKGELEGTCMASKSTAKGSMARRRRELKGEQQAGLTYVSLGISEGRSSRRLKG